VASGWNGGEKLAGIIQLNGSFGGRVGEILTDMVAKTTRPHARGFSISSSSSSSFICRVCRNGQ